MLLTEGEPDVHLGGLGLVSRVQLACVPGVQRTLPAPGWSVWWATIAVYSVLCTLYFVHNCTFLEIVDYFPFPSGNSSA